MGVLNNVAGSHPPPATCASCPMKKHIVQYRHVGVRVVRRLVAVELALHGAHVHNVPAPDQTHWVRGGGECAFTRLRAAPPVKSIYHIHQSPNHYPLRSHTCTDTACIETDRPRLVGALMSGTSLLLMMNGASVLMRSVSATSGASSSSGPHSAHKASSESIYKVQ